jgi:hypothetical protein
MGIRDTNKSPMARWCVLIIALVAHPAAGFVVPLLAPRADAGSHACARWAAAWCAPRRPRRGAVGLGAGGLRSQQQAQDSPAEAAQDAKEGGRQGTAALFGDGAPFPPPWLLPFLVPAAGGALFGYDIGTNSDKCSL